MAATVIGRPRIEPELSISSVTTVSRNSVSARACRRAAARGLTTTRGRRAASSMPSSRSNSQRAVLLGQQAALQRLASLADHGLQMDELLVQQLPQPRQLVGIAQLGGLDHLVELVGEGR